MNEVINEDELKCEFKKLLTVLEKMEKETKDIMKEKADISIKKDESRMEYAHRMIDLDVIYSLRAYRIVHPGATQVRYINIYKAPKEAQHLMSISNKYTRAGVYTTAEEFEKRKKTEELK